MIRVLVMHMNISHQHHDIRVRIYYGCFLYMIICSVVIKSGNLKLLIIQYMLGNLPKNAL